MNQSNIVCVRWNKHHTNLVSVFDALFDNERLTDCTISAEGRLLRAHKIILSACSPYFEELFTDSDERHPIIILHDVKYDLVKALMDFMYRGEVNISQEELSGVLELSEYLQVRGLSRCGSVNDCNLEEGSGRSAPLAPAEILRSQATSVSCFVSGQNEQEEKLQTGRSCSPTVLSQEGKCMDTDSISESIQNHTKSINQCGPEQRTSQNAFEEAITADVDNLHEFPSQRQVLPTISNSAGGRVHSQIQALKALLSGTHTILSSSSSSSLCNLILHQSQHSELQISSQEMDTAVTERFLKPEAVLTEKSLANLSAHQHEDSPETKLEVLKRHIEIVEDDKMSGNLSSQKQEVTLKPKYEIKKNDLEIVEDLTLDDDDDYSNGGAENEQFLASEVVVDDKLSGNLCSQQQEVTLKPKSEIKMNDLEIVEDLTLDDDDSYSGADNHHHACNSTELDRMEYKRVTDSHTYEEKFHIQGTDSQHSPFGSDYWNNVTLTTPQMVLHHRYCCDSCGKSYQYLKSLQRHSKYECRKKPQFRCPQCSSVFIRSDTLNRHIKYECAKIPQFQCPHCRHWFTRNDHLKRHLVRFHYQEQKNYTLTKRDV